MRITQDDGPFRPLNIRLESESEMNNFTSLIDDHDTNHAIIELSNKERKLLHKYQIALEIWLV